MALDPDTNYYALSDSDTGVTPGVGQSGTDTSSIDGVSPALDPTTSIIAAIAARYNLPFQQAAQVYAQSQTPQGQQPPGAAAPATDPSINAVSNSPYVPGQPAVPLAGPGGIPQPLPPDLSGINPAIDTLGQYQAGTPAGGSSMPLAAVPPVIAALKANAQTAPGAALPSTQAAPGALPKHNNTAIQILGTLAALAGGPGGRIAGQYLQTQRQNDIADQQRTQQATQQQFLNNTAQSENGSAFLQNLAKLDDASQEQTVRNMTPAQMMAAGFTPAGVKSEFFDANGKFVPVSANDSKMDAATLRAQVTNRGRLFQLTQAGQQQLHDVTYKDKADQWQQDYGVPYDGFTPAETQRDATAQGTLAERTSNDTANQGIKRTAIQDIAYKNLHALTLAAQTNEWNSYASNPQGFESKYGTPYSSFKAGQTDANANTETAVANRETDAQRTDATRTTLGKLNIAARALIDKDDNAVRMRGQDIDQQKSKDQIAARSNLFMRRYGAQNVDKAEKTYQSLLKERMGVMKEMTRLSTPGKDPLTGDPTLSIRDQGRIDANGNIVPNPVPTAAYTEYMQLQQYDTELQQKLFALKHPEATAAPGPPPGTPAAAGFASQGDPGYTGAAGAVFPAGTVNAPSAPPRGLPPANIHMPSHFMPTRGLGGPGITAPPLPAMAAQGDYNLSSPNPLGTTNFQLAPMPKAFAGKGQPQKAQQGGGIIRYTLHHGNQVEQFTQPMSQADYNRLPMEQKTAYVRDMQARGLTPKSRGR